MLMVRNLPLTSIGNDAILSQVNGEPQEGNEVYENLWDFEADDLNELSV